MNTNFLTVHRLWGEEKIGVSQTSIWKAPAITPDVQKQIAVAKFLELLANLGVNIVILRMQLF